MKNPNWGVPLNYYLKDGYWYIGGTNTGVSATGIQGTKGEKGDPGLNGGQGEQGMSAYTHALQNGFVGSVSDWLASLKGEQGPKGDTGAQGVPGVQGPYGGVGLTGAPGPKGDPGLNGAKGDPGVPGPRGVPGPQGIPGTRGAQGVQGLKGDKGDKGDPGEDAVITDGSITEQKLATEVQGKIKDINILRKSIDEYKTKITSRPYVLESFKNTADFTSSRCTLSQDTTNFLTGASALSALCTDNSTYNYIKKTVVWNLTDADDLELKLYIADKTMFTQIYLYLFKTGSIFANAKIHTFNNGWNTYRFAKSDFAITGVFLWSTITSFQINFYPAASTYPTLVVDSLKKNVVEPASVVFVFDDGWESAYSEAYAYMNGKGYKGSLAINGNTIGTPTFLTLAQLTEMYNAGWDVLNHGYPHADYSAMTYTNVATNIQNGTNWLYSNGFTKGNNIMIYPTSYSDIGRQVVKDLGFVVARGLTGRTNYASADDILNLKSLVLNNTSTFATTVQPYLDSLMGTGGMLLITIHDLKTTPTIATEISIAVFREIVDYCEANSINVTTLTEWYNNLF